MRRGWKIVTVAATVLLTGVLLFFFIQEEQTKREQESRYEEMEKALRPLELESRQVRQELEELDEKYETDSQGIGSLVLMFTDCSEIIYTDIFPQMQDYGYTGVLVLSEEYFPGQDGCVSQEQFRELIDAGWKCALRWEKDMDTSEWLVSGSRLAREAGIARPKAVYFPQDSYRIELDEFLLRQRFTVAVHHGEDGLPIISSETGEGIWHSGAMGFNQKGSAANLSGSIEQRGNLILTEGADAEGGQYAADVYTRMLAKISGYCEAGDLMVTDLPGAMDYRRELESGREAVEKEYQEQKALLEEELEELERQNDETIERYMGKQALQRRAE